MSETTKICDLCGDDIDEEQEYWTIQDYGPLGLYKPKVIGYVCDPCKEADEEDEEDDDWDEE